MKRLFVMAAGLGYRTLERHGMLKLAGLEFQAAPSVFPAVTCTAQASWRTGLMPREHGMTSNGYFSRKYMKPSFWEQSAKLVEGRRVWETARERGEKVGMYFWQQSLGESVDYVVSPAPIHRHGGGMIMRNYTQPPEMAEEVRKVCGSFPLHRYWGPLASARVGRAVVANFLASVECHEPDWALLYLPTLDYEAQRHGPDSPAAKAALKEFASQLERLLKLASARGAEVTVMGDYEIEAVTREPAYPNRTLRAAGLFKVRPVGSMAYPDFYASQAFAMCDHQVAHVYVQGGEDEVRKVAALFEATGEYESVEVRGDQAWAHPSAGEVLLTARAGGWCAYPWWTDRREGPDWSTHIDIHNKPGYDPCELFFDRRFPIPPSTCQDCTRIRGTHGRPCDIAIASAT